jgi:hypothetical protein
MDRARLMVVNALVDCRYGDMDASHSGGIGDPKPGLEAMVGGERFELSTE